MMGRTVYDVAVLVSEAASQKVAECTEEGEDPLITLRGGLVLALVASEAERGTPKAELVAYLERMYDLINHPTVMPPPNPRN